MESTTLKKRHVEDIINQISEMLPGQVSEVTVKTADGKKHHFKMDMEGHFIKEKFQIAFSKIRFMIADAWNRQSEDNKINLDGSTGELR